MIDVEGGQGLAHARGIAIVEDLAHRIVGGDIRGLRPMIAGGLGAQGEGLDHQGDGHVAPGDGHVHEGDPGLVAGHDHPGDGRAHPGDVRVAHVVSIPEAPQLLESDLVVHAGRLAVLTGVLVPEAPQHRENAVEVPRNDRPLLRKNHPAHRDLGNAPTAHRKNLEVWKTLLWKVLTKIQKKNSKALEVKDLHHQKLSPRSAQGPALFLLRKWRRNKGLHFVIL